MIHQKISGADTKKEEVAISWNGFYLKVHVDASLERVKVLFCWKDGRDKRVSFSNSHRDKRPGEF